MTTNQQTDEEKVKAKWPNAEARPISELEEISWLKAWIKKESKRDWVPWLKPIIAANKRRLEELERGQP